ncbi:MAG: hypothetical protein JXN59_03660 [Anaerolineae bacterium]|nr:hypothetical protein [Anaerolineae bacterium]
MTDRLYYTDAYTTAFDARIIERTTIDGRPAIALDRTYFYPTSGGQPHDTGHINDVAVLDVIVREADQAVLHVIVEPVQADAVAGVIDWPRRFDHMQHHTGQHILTAAFIETAGVHTMSFHLGAENVTIDLDRVGLTDAQVGAAEEFANEIVMQNRAVRVWFPTPDELAALPVRKLPDVNGKVRIVGIDGLDYTACGGTHVAQTGEIGQIKVIRTEKYKDMTRVEFRCGMRALHDYRDKNALLLATAADLTIGYGEIGDAIDRFRVEIKQLRSDLRAARQALLAAEAQDLWAAVPPRNGVRVVVGAWAGRDPAELRPLASHLIARPGTVALLGAAGEKAQVVLARAEDLPGPDMVALLRSVVGRLTGEGESQRGGGRPEFAQGGGVSAGQAQLQEVLDWAAGEAWKQLI